MTSHTGSIPSDSHAEVPHPSRVRDLKRERAQLARDMFAAGDPGAARRRALSDLVLGRLAEHWNSLTENLDSGVALAAIGSTGRRDGGPFSDLDLLIIHDGETHKAKHVGELAQAFWYPIWDAGLELDHATRSISECRQVANKDVSSAAGLLDVRAVAGDAGVAQRARAWILADWRAAAPKRLPDLIAASRARAERFGEVAYLTEPNLKESRGGIRDATSLSALAATWLTDRPHGSVDQAIDLVLDIRDAVHLVNGRGANILNRQISEEVAEVAGYGTIDDLLRDVAEAGREIAYALDTTERAARRALETSKRGSRAFVARRKRRAPRFTSVATGLIDVDGELALAQGYDAAGDALLPLRTAATAATTGLAITPKLLETLNTCPDLPRPWPEEARELLLELLRSGPALPAVWEAFDLHGYVLRWIPEWEGIRSRPQRAPQHVFTVDRHCIDAVVHASKLRRDVPLPDTLLYAALLHDIGKRDGAEDHSIAGAHLVPTIADRMGIDGKRAGDLATLVRHHLLLSELATGSDPVSADTIGALVAPLGRRLDLLETLRALTEADAKAVGPKTWNDWRQSLVDTLTDEARVELGAARRATGGDADAG